MGNLVEKIAGIPHPRVCCEECGTQLKGVRKKETESGNCRHGICHPDIKKGHAEHRSLRTAHGNGSGARKKKKKKGCSKKWRSKGGGKFFVLTLARFL